MWALNKVSILVFNSLARDRLHCSLARLALYLQCCVQTLKWLFTKYWIVLLFQIVELSIEGLCIPAVNQLLMVCTSRVGKFKYVTNKQLDYSGWIGLLFTKMLLNVLLKVPEALYMGCLWKVTNCSIDQIFFTIRANGFNQCEFLLQTIRCRKEVIITVNCFCWCTRLGLRSDGDCLMYVAVKFLVCNGLSTIPFSSYWHNVTPGVRGWLLGITCMVCNYAYAH